MAATTSPLSAASPTALASRFSEAYAAWRRAPLILHVAAILALSVIPLLRWNTELFDLRTALTDEIPYNMAFERIAAGESPFGGTGYLYPPVFAVLGAKTEAALGRPATTALMRIVNLLGLGTTVWLALAWLPLRLRARFCLGAAYVLLAPLANFGILLGNFSLAVSGLTLLALVTFGSFPILAGVLLGTGIALKPIAAFAVPALALYRFNASRWRPWLTATVAFAVVVLLIAPFPFASEFLELSSSPRVGRTVTLHRFPALFGLEINALWISAPIALATLLVLLRARLGPAKHLCLTLTAALACTPLVWSHTLLLALPLQGLALHVVVSRVLDARRKRGERGKRSQSAEPYERGERGGRSQSAEPYERGDRAGRSQSAEQSERGATRLGPGPPRRLAYELVFVMLAIAGIQFAAGAGNIGDQSVLLQAPAAAIPALSPALLTAYLFRTTASF